jgi:hypothetical protein
MPDDTSTMSGQRRVTRPCTEREAAVWLTRTAEGRQWANQHRGSKSMRQLVFEACEASRLAAAAVNAAAARDQATDKRKEAPMSSTTTILKSARALGEHGVTALIQKHADSVRLPNETSAQAFVRVFTADDATGKALRYVHSVAKGVVTADSPDGLGRSEGVRSGALSASAYDASDAELEDSAEDDRDSALALLEQLADKLRAKRPELSKAAAFSKVYCDPANVALAARERAQSRRRLGVAV